MAIQNSKNQNLKKYTILNYKIGGGKGEHA